MTKEFVKYEQALALKELGFDEPCMAIYYSKDKSFSWHHHKDHINNEPTLDSGEFNISAPLKQQTFRWFREKHKVTVWIIAIGDLYRWNLALVQDDSYSLNVEGDFFNTYEKAEQACLDKLIEIVNNK